MCLVVAAVVFGASRLLGIGKQAVEAQEVPAPEPTVSVEIPLITPTVTGRWVWVRDADVSFYVDFNGKLASTPETFWLLNDAEGNPTWTPLETDVVLSKDVSQAPLAGEYYYSEPRREGNIGPSGVALLPAGHWVWSCPGGCG